MSVAPFISVVIDTYNHERFIEDAIVSALEQDISRSDVEILVVDDGSTDGTADVVRKFKPLVRYIQKPNGGQASAVNFGTMHSTGRLVAYLDGDDVWMPNKLSRVAEEFEKDPLLALVYHRYCFWDSRDNSTWDPEYFGAISGNIFDDRRKLVRYTAAPTSSLTLRRSTLEQIMPIPEECSFMHDCYLVYCAACLGPVKSIDECLTRNRIHGQNLWFVGSGKTNTTVLRNRIQVRDAAITCTQRWFRLNAPRNAQRKARTLFASLRLIQDQDEFRLKSPNRFRFFWYSAKYNLTYASTMSRNGLAYKWSWDLAALLLGRRAHYVEGVWRRGRKMINYFRRRLVAENGQPD